MTRAEKNICDVVLREGQLLQKAEFDCEGLKIAQYVVELGGEKYHLTKHDGAWVYFFHSFN